ncbi:MAG TPA: hemerythrin domain-containing protein [Oleiagrimonas sp.]|nr:hemerythrin domain-containing protein [Oleiagrimonas sp.]
MFKELFTRQRYEPFPMKLQQTDVPKRMETVEPVSPGVAPGTRITYHPDLINRFHAHHVALQKEFKSIRAHAADNEFAAAQKSLQAFRRTLTSHLLEENIKLYTYLGRCLDNDPVNKDLMASMKSEMGQIGNQVMRFVNEYVNAGITPFNKKQFVAELDAIGVILLDRIDREESSLYALYMPPETFS